ncbi:hypothetical protein Abr02nite_84540 [Paractinoplanes brasiliensis]|nr:hypothetical protein Abr02nite_84540 [Actinoplanes brasiliensis]
MWACVLEVNTCTGDAVTNRSRVCRLLAASGPGTFGEAPGSAGSLPPETVRPVTLLYDADRLWIDITARRTARGRLPAGRGPDRPEWPG